MHLAAVGTACCAQGLAVDGDHGPVGPRPAGKGRVSALVQPSGEDLGEQAGVQPGQQPPHRRGGRNIFGEPEPGPAGLIQVVQPVADRGERLRSGEGGAYRDREQAGR